MQHKTVLDYIELNIKHKKKIYTSSTHKQQTTICTVEYQPNQVYCSMKESKREEEPEAVLHTDTNRRSSME